MADPRRRTFGPVVLIGLASAGLAAVAGHRTWGRLRDVGASDPMVATAAFGEATAPLAGALALVLLACWGVLLVTRGRFRRAVAVLGLLTALGMVVAGIRGLRTATAGLRDELDAIGVPDPAVGTTVWPWVYLAAAVVAVLAALAAVRFVPGWPEMGSRYDAPGSDPATTDAGATGIDLWRALDEGRDPTLTDRKSTDP